MVEVRDSSDSIQAPPQAIYNLNSLIGFFLVLLGVAGKLFSLFLN